MLKELSHRSWCQILAQNQHPLPEFVLMGESAEELPFSVANILKLDLPISEVTKKGQSSLNANKALTLAERIAGKFYFFGVLIRDNNNTTTRTSILLNEAK